MNGEERKMNPVERVHQYFGVDDLPAHLQETARNCKNLADWVLANLPIEAETTAGMRKLLEAKDCFLRAML